MSDVVPSALVRPYRQIADAGDPSIIVQIGVVQRDLADRDDEQRLRPAAFELEQPPRLQPSCT